MEPGHYLAMISMSLTHVSIVAPLGLVLRHYVTHSPYEFALPSGKRLHNYRKSAFLMGKSTINGNFQ